MQNNFLTSIRSLKLIDGCKGAQVYTVNPLSTAGEKLASLRPTFSLRSKSIGPQLQPHHHHSPSFDSLLSTFGLPSIDLIDPPIDPFIRPIEPIDALASSFRAISSTASSSSSSSLCDIYLEHHSLLRSVGDPKQPGAHPARTPALL
ncbi:hypothetical protein HPP92_002903 [Vanilla planifolia]|uniref:Uncharacterized protein n=1 Tax=Vanilla planifolia TaxID=51239 RepID=A0A835SAP6_VANPL|nr:hypothetical protein HPP92_002903 [Vanilla planifolia]